MKGATNIKAAFVIDNHYYSIRFYKTFNDQFESLTVQLRILAL